MNNLKLEIIDLEQIESILRNNKNIERLYKKLYTLELEGKKDTDEYIKLLDYLSIVIDVENKLYKEANLTFEKTLTWICFLNRNNINSIDMRKNILSSNYYDNILSRILNNLYGLLMNNYSTMLNLQYNELISISNILGINITKQEKNSTIYKCIISKNAIEKDIYYVFLSFLQTNIDNSKHKIFKDKLVETKYNTIFIHKDIESLVIKNNFNIPNPPYIYSNITRKLLEIDMNFYKKEKDLISSNIVNNEITEILKVYNTDYNDIIKASTSFIRQIMLETALLFMSDDKICDINFDFHEFISSKEYQTKYSDNTISETSIINSFKNIKKNKDKIKVLKV